LSNSLLIEVKESVRDSYKELEKKIEESVSNAMSNQKDKISWGIELIRFFIVSGMFFLSIKMVTE